jgi:pyridoxal 5'-phosphate synthase pdxT subunit
VRQRFGVLALQGDFAAHVQALREAGADAREVRRVSELGGLSGLVIPGGESTTLLRHMEDAPWFDAIRHFHAAGGVLVGTCAGAILLAREVRPKQPSLALLDAAVHRNAYGRQVDSFETVLDAPGLGGALPALFIRAPRFERLGPDVEILATHGDEPVLLQQGRVLAATFHPELTASRAVHEHALRLADPRFLGQSSTQGALA